MRHPLRLASILFLPVLCFSVVYLSVRPRGEAHAPPPAAALRAGQGSGEEDEREDETVSLPTGERMRFLVVGIDNTGGLADVVLYAVLNAADSSLCVLQLPRDLYIGGNYASGKLNEACLPFSSKNPAARIETLLSERFCLPTDASVCVTLAGVRAAVDLLGGVPIELVQDVDYLPGKTLSAGPQTLTGEQAEWLLRYRAGYENADLGRLAMQRTFLGALFSRFSKVGRGEALSLAAKLYGYVKTTLPLSEAAQLFAEARKLSPEAITFSTAPVYGAEYKGLSVLCMNRYRLAETLNATVLSHDPVSPWELTVETPPPAPALPPEPSQEGAFDFSWNEEETGDDALEGVIRRQP